MSSIILQSNTKKLRGFTLVEMLVVLGLFSFIMTLATSVLYSTQAINVKLQESQAVLDNVNLSMDTMSRDIRYGSDFHCSASSTQQERDIRLRKSCSYSNPLVMHGGRVLFFKPTNATTDSDRVAYYASSTTSGDVILKDEYFGGSTTTYQITANDVKIKSLFFYVEGANTASSVAADVDGVHDYTQPLITLTVAGETIPLKEGSSSTPFIIETSISSRGIDK